MFDARQASEFVQRPYAMDAISLRRWDDRAKSVDASVPSFDYWLPLLREVAFASALSLTQ
jgi:gamma-butyrobetaine dioxygenase